MKFLTKLFAAMLAVVTVFAFSACNGNKDDDKNNQFGWALEVESETVKAENESEQDKKVLTIKGFFVAQGTLNQIASGIAKNIELKIGEGEFNVYDEATGAYDTKDDYAEYDEVIIDKDVFVNQQIIGSVIITDKVTEIGEGAFGGCPNITKMTLPFVGIKKADVYNVQKTFAALFGTNEVTGCTSMTVNYNSSGSGTYYLPSGLTDVTVNYSEKTELPAYAFAGITVLKNVTLVNVTEIGNSAFAGCSALTNVNVKTAADKTENNAADVTAIGSSAFANCTSLYGIDLASFTNANLVVYNEAFSGCTKLGATYDELVLPGATFMEKAFSGCTSIKALDLTNAKFVGDYCFKNCTGLKKVKGYDGTKTATGAFLGCTLDDEHFEVDDYGNLVKKTQTID